MRSYPNRFSFHRGAELLSRKCIHQGVHSKVCPWYGNKQGFSGTKRKNRFHLQNFNLDSITVCPNGYPFAGTPLQTENDKKLYLNSLEDLAFGQHGHGAPYIDYANHYILVIDLTTTQEASLHYLYAEITN